MGLVGLVMFEISLLATWSRVGGVGNLLAVGDPPVLLSEVGVPAVSTMNVQVTAPD